MIKKATAIIIFLFCARTVFAAVVIDKPEDRVFFGSGIEYFEDKNNLPFSSIQKKNTGWKTNSLNTLSFGITGSAYWIKFSLENRTGDRLYLTFNTINNDSISLFIPDGKGGYAEKTGGSMYPFDHREVHDKDIFFVIPVIDGEKTFYARFASHYVLTMAPEIVPEKKMGRRAIDAYLSAVFSHGIFFALLMYHLLVFISSREKSYLYLVLLIASFQLYDLIHDGLGYMFVWPDSVFFEGLVLPLSLSLMGISSGLYIQQSIETRKNFRIIYHVLNALIISGFIICVLCFTAPRPVNMAIILVYAILNSILTTIMLFYAGIIKGNRSALLILIAYILFEGSNMIAISATNPALIKHIAGLNDASFVLTLGKYTRVVFVLLFSFVLTDKISTMKKSLEINEETYRSIFNGTSEAICIMDTKEFRVRDANRTLLELFRMERYEVMGKTSDYFSAVEDGYTREKAEELYREALGSRTVQADVLFRKSTGEKFWADVIVNDVIINGEQTLMVIIRDISDRKNAEEEKEKILQQLIQAQKMEAVGSLAGGLAHDFNNFLAGILGSSTMAKTHLDRGAFDKDKIAEYLDIIRELSIKASGTVKRLLTITRKHELKFSPADLNTLLKNVVDVCRNSFPKSVAIEARYLPSPAMVKADSTGMEQVFLNILVNASHAVTIMREPPEPEGGTVSLKIERQYADDFFCRQNKDAIEGIHYFAISVQDNGCGIDTGVIDRIFDPFFSTKSKSKGSGLGLSMVYTIIGHHKGLIKVYSEKGKGTTFIVYIPEDTSGERAEQENRKDIIEGHGNILVVDDEDFVLKVAREILVYCGYDVFTASSGAEGIDMYRKNAGNIDLVLLDMSMPGLSGLETYDELKKIRHDVRVIMSSGFSMDERVQKALSMGVNAFIQKPYTNIELSKAVADVLGNNER